MSGLNNSSAVKEQYKTSDNLSTRISIHDKYSVNKMGFGNWIVSHYGELEGLRVLELGCGTGSIWKGHEALLDSAEMAVLSDFSEGMLTTAKNLLGERENLTYKIIDIQDIPFEDKSFDVVIANMMLYHVPDIHKGLSEVRRVLKDGGKFFTATYGQHGITEFMAEVLRDTSFRDELNRNFTLQNGGEILESHFNSVTRYNYEDALEVTVTEDLADYMLSLTSMAEVNLSRDELITLLDTKKNNGVIHVQKEYGLFVCSK